MTDTTAAAAPPVDQSARWLEAEAAIRSTMGEFGLMDRDAMRTKSGMEVFEAIRRGELPPPMIGKTLGFIAVDFAPGRFVFQGTPGREHYNPLGMVHGGYAATLLDSCVGCAIHTTLPAGVGYTTLELKVNYIRGMSDRTGPVRAEGEVISAGKQVAVAEGRLTDSTGRLLAFATTTCLIFPI